MRNSVIEQRSNTSRGHSLTACYAAPPSKSKMAARGQKMANGVWKGVYLQVFGHSKQLSQNKFFDPSTPSMIKVDNGEKKKDVVFSGH